jgi:hypothetical protein
MAASQGRCATRLAISRVLRARRPARFGRRLAQTVFFLALLSGTGCEAIAGIDKLRVGSVDQDAMPSEEMDAANDSGEGEPDSAEPDSGEEPDANDTTPDSGPAAPDAGGSDATVSSMPDAEAGTPDADGPAPCSGLMCNGICVPNDETHCGSCDHDCTQLPNLVGSVTCDAGRCVFGAEACAPGFAHCSTRADDGCETDLTNPAHCGACTTACRAPTPLCADGPATGSDFACASSCTASAPTLCGQTCVNTGSSPAHCNMCDHACPAVSGGQPVCNSSACDFTCNSSFHKCGSSCLANTSVLGCGTSSCSPCTDPANGAPTCNGTTCDVQCDSGYHACNSNSCLSNTAPASCGTRCTPCPAAPANGSATCVSGACDFSCATDYFKSGATCLRRNIYVSTGGSDSAAGTQAAPYRTYDRALNGAVSGQIVNFAAGSYAEAFTRAIPDGLTLQRTSGEIGTVVFTGTGAETITFAGSGTMRQIRLNTFGVPLRATTGAQTLEGVTVVTPTAAVQLSGTASMTTTDCSFSGSPPVAGEAYASLMRLKGNARLTARGTTSFTGNYFCGSGADRTAALYATDSAQVDFNATTIAGAFYNGALYFDNSAALLMTNSNIDVGSTCTNAGLFYGSSTLQVTGGTYKNGLVVSGANVNLTIDGGTFSGGIGWAQGNNFRARNARIDLISILGSISGAVDLGTAASPGNNDFSQGSSYGLFAQVGSTTVVLNVSGNKWHPSVQGADANGRYAVGTVVTSGTGMNYYLVFSAELHF